MQPISLELRRCGHSAVAWGDDGAGLLVFGGMDFGDRATDSLLELPAPFTTYRRLPAGASIGARAYHFGGLLTPDCLLVYGGGLFRDCELKTCFVAFGDVVLYHRGGAVEKLHTAPPADLCRHSVFAAIHRRSLVVFGGGQTKTELAPADAVMRFDVDARAWRRLPTTGAAPPAGRSGTAAVVADTFFVCGGGRNYADLRNTVHALDLAGLVWREVLTTGGPPTPRYTHAAMLLPAPAGGRLPQRLLLYGGYSWTAAAAPPHRPCDTSLPDAYVLDLPAAGGATGHWARVAGLLPRHGHTLTAVCGHAVAVGGAFHPANSVEEKWAEAAVLRLPGLRPGWTREGHRLGTAPFRGRVVTGFTCLLRWLPGDVCAAVLGYVEVE